MKAAYLKDGVWFCGANIVVCKDCGRELTETAGLIRVDGYFYCGHCASTLDRSAECELCGCVVTNRAELVFSQGHRYCYKCAREKQLLGWKGRQLELGG